MTERKTHRKAVSAKTARRILDLDALGFSVRWIAVQVTVSRETVKAVLSRPAEYLIEPEKPVGRRNVPHGEVVRCPACGGKLTIEPCVACGGKRG